MNEKLTYERLYDLISALLSQMPSLLDAFAALPFTVQQIALSVILIVAIPAIMSIVFVAEKLWIWWSSRH